MFHTREDWLHAAAEALAPEFKERTGLTVPRVRIACGFPHRGGIGRKNGGRVIGECWPPELSSDRTYHQISVTPLLDDAVQVLAVLVHELVHATVGCAAGHGKQFKDAAVELGLGGKMTATVPTDDGLTWLTGLAAWLGPYPHAKLDPFHGTDTGGGDGGKRGPWSPDTPRKQPARLLKVQCADCGYVARVTRKWLESTGAPLCPCNHEPMIEG